MNRSIVRLAVIAMVSAFLLMACGMTSALASSPDKLESILKRGEVRVGVMLICPPFGMYDQKNQPIGFDVDIAKLMAQRLGVKLTLVPVLAANRVPYLVSDKVDVVIGTFSRTLERAKTVDFTVPYAMTGPIVCTKKGSGIKSVHDLKGKKVSVVKGTTGAIWLKKLCPEANVIEYDYEPDMLLALKQDKVAALVNDTTIISAYIKDNPELEMVGDVFYEDYLAFGVRKGEYNWRYWLNLFIFDLYNLHEIDDLWAKWFNYPLPKMHYTPFF